MRDDDDALAGIDLAAWQPPPPPADLANAVLARLREPAPAAAVEPHERTWRWPRWIGGAAAVLAAAAVAAVWLSRSPAQEHGERVTTRAEQLALDGSVADLDAGAELRWSRHGGQITAHQTRGTVRWTVADDDTLVIDPVVAGGPRGATTTIVASGASLRVEVSMNLSDVRMLGASTVTAVAVALVTVVVYTGHVKVTSGGQTVNVTPGTTVELRPPAPPADVTSPRREPIAVGASSADVERLQEELKTANDKIAALTGELAARPVVSPINVPPATLESLRVRGDRNIVPDGATRDAIARAGGGKVSGSWKLCIDTRGAVATVNLLRSTKFDAYDRAIAQAMNEWAYSSFVHDGQPTAVCSVVTIVYDARPDRVADRDRATPPAEPAASDPDEPAASDPDEPAMVTTRPEPCDSMNVNDRISQAQNQYQAGFSKAALALISKALACKQDVRMYRQATLYACVAHDRAAARRMFQKVPEQYQPLMQARCQQEGINLHADP